VALLSDEQVLHQSSETELLEDDCDFVRLWGSDPDWALQNLQGTRVDDCCNMSLFRRHGFPGTRTVVGLPPPSTRRDANRPTAMRLFSGSPLARVSPRTDLRQSTPGQVTECTSCSINFSPREVSAPTRAARAAAAEVSICHLCHVHACLNLHG